MSDAIKLCRNCVHARPDWLGGWEFAKCQTAPCPPDAGALVTGRGIAHSSFLYCENERASGDCGPVGINFQPKPRPWWVFWRKK